MRRIDAHQHFWSYDPGRHSWITDEMKVLRRDYLPGDLEPELRAAGFDGCVAVQADQSLEETGFLLKAARENPFVAGVVGWLDLCSGAIGEQLERFAGDPYLKGVRHIVQDEPDDRFLIRPDFLRGVAMLEQYGLTYDILIYARHLPVAVEFVERFPDRPFVLDHIAKPLIGEGKIADWEQGIRELAQHPMVCCKVSGLVTEADWDSWTPDQIWPYLDVVFDAFGTDRVMFGSDWPVCRLAAGYREVTALVEEYTASLTPQEQARFFGGNAKRFYGLE